MHLKCRTWPPGKAEGKRSSSATVPSPSAVNVESEGLAEASFRDQKPAARDAIQSNVEEHKASPPASETLLGPEAQALQASISGSPSSSAVHSQTHEEGLPASMKGIGQGEASILNRSDSRPEPTPHNLEEDRVKSPADVDVGNAAQPSLNLQEIANETLQETGLMSKDQPAMEDLFAGLSFD